MTGKEARMRFVAAAMVTGLVGLLSLVFMGATSGPGACGLADAAFCETFDAPAVNRDYTHTRTGDLDPVVWGVSRYNTRYNVSGGTVIDWPAATMRGCGPDQIVSPPRDVQICGGKLHDAVNDQGSIPVLAIYPKQPFDWTGRTGKVVFDVGNDSEGGHTAWPEFWITDQPVPVPQTASNQPVVPTRPRMALGFDLSNCTNGGQQNGQVGIIGLDVVRNYVEEFHPTGGGFACLSKGSQASLNHFEIRVSVDTVEIYGTDAGQVALKLIGRWTGLNLPFTRGLIWLENTHYDACKFNCALEDHGFAWDNVGFDGPTPYRDLTFDVQDKAPNELGWRVTSFNPPVVLTTAPVFRLQQPTSALVLLTWGGFTLPRVSVNGGPVHEAPNVFEGGDVHTIAIPVPLSEVIDGPNRLSFTTSGQTYIVANVNLALIAAAPGAASTPTPTVSASPTASPSPTASATPTPTPTAAPECRDAYFLNGTLTQGAVIPCP